MFAIDVLLDAAVWEKYKDAALTDAKDSGAVFLDRVRAPKETDDANIRRVLMLSGGVGSCGTLYRMLSFFGHFEVAHVEARFVDQKLNEERRKCCHNILALTKDRDGKHLITADELSRPRSWCSEHYAFSPRSFQQTEMPFEWKMIYMMWLILLKQQHQPRATVHFYWGSYDARLLPALHYSVALFREVATVRHFFPVASKARSLLSVAVGEGDACRMMSLYDCYYQPNSLSSCLPYNVTNRLVSCRRSELRLGERCETTPFKSLFLLAQSSAKPFYSFCGACAGCRPFLASWEELKRDMPGIRIGNVERSGPGDDRNVESFSFVDGFGDVEKRKKDIKNTFRGKDVEHDYSEFEKSKKKLDGEDSDDDEEEEDENDFVSEALQEMRDDDDEDLEQQPPSETNPAADNEGSDSDDDDGRKVVEISEFEAD